MKASKRKHEKLAPAPVWVAPLLRKLSLLTGNFFETAGKFASCFDPKADI